MTPKEQAVKAARDCYHGDAYGNPCIECVEAAITAALAAEPARPNLKPTAELIQSLRDAGGSDWDTHDAPEPDCPHSVVRMTREVFEEVIDCVYVAVQYAPAATASLDQVKEMYAQLMVARDEQHAVIGLQSAALTPIEPAPADLITAADAYTDDPERRADFIAGWYAGQRAIKAEADIATVLRDAQRETRHLAAAELAGEKIDSETMEFRMKAIAAEPAPVDLEGLAKELRAAWDTSNSENPLHRWLAVARRSVERAGPRWHSRCPGPGLYAVGPQTIGSHSTPAEFIQVDDPHCWSGLQGRWYGPIPPTPEATT